jgi:hypothetical protein
MIVVANFGSAHRKGIAGFSETLFGSIESLSPIRWRFAVEALSDALVFNF